MKPNLFKNEKIKMLEFCHDQNDYYFTIITGLPGSGKTTYANKLKEINPNSIVINMDLVNKILFSGEPSCIRSNKIIDLILTQSGISKYEHLELKHYFTTFERSFYSTESFIKSIYNLCKDKPMFRRRFVLEGECFMLLSYIGFLTDCIMNKTKWKVLTYPVIKSYIRKTIREYKGAALIEYPLIPFAVLFNIPNDYSFYKKERKYYDYLLNQLKYLESKLPFEHR